MKKIDQIKQIYELSKDFGKKIYFYDILSKIFRSDNLYKQKNDEITKYLEKKYNSAIEKFLKIDDTSDNIKIDCPIWVFWAQGFDNAPELVQGCLRQLQSKKGNHKIIMLHKDNYKDYVHIPKAIIDKFESGTITLVNFTDILRVSLLAEHGGIWMDATIFLADSIDFYLENTAFFTINNHIEESYRYVSNYRWTGFFMACGENNYLINYLREIFYEYWENENKLIDYFLIDYLIVIGYRNLDKVKRLIDKVPYSNPDIYWLNKKLSEEFKLHDYNGITEKTRVFKLNWRYKSADNSDSYYSILLHRGNIEV